VHPLLTRMLALTLPLLLTACGGGDGSTTPATPTASSVPLLRLTPPGRSPSVEYYARNADGKSRYFVRSQGAVNTFDDGLHWYGSDLRTLQAAQDLTYFAPGMALVTTPDYGMVVFDFTVDSGKGYVCTAGGAYRPGDIWRYDTVNRRLWALRHTYDAKTIDAYDDTSSIQLISIGIDDYYDQTTHACNNTPAWSYSPSLTHTLNLAAPHRFTPSLHLLANGDVIATSLYALVRSSNQGQSWTPLAMPDAINTTGVAITPLVTRAGTLIAALPDQAAVSRDGGLTWAALHIAGDAGLDENIPYLRQSSDDGALYTAKTLHSAHPYLSYDEGRTWQKLGDLSTFGDDPGDITYLYRDYAEIYLDVEHWGGFRSDYTLSRLGLFPETQFDIPFIAETHRYVRGTAIPIRDPSTTRPGFLGIWDGPHPGLARWYQGDVAWQVGAFYNQPTFIKRMANDEIILVGVDGIRFSADEGRTWSDPAIRLIDQVGLNLAFTNLLELGGGTLLMEARNSADCVQNPHLVSHDYGRSWSLFASAPVPTGTLNGQPAAGQYNTIELRSVDNDGILFGYANRLAYDFADEKSSCHTEASSPVRSDDGGITWPVQPSISVPEQANSQNSLIDYTLTLDHTSVVRLWRQGASRWAELGPITLDGTPLTDQAFTYPGSFRATLDPDDRAYFIYQGRVVRTPPLR